MAAPLSGNAKIREIANRWDEAIDLTHIDMGPLASPDAEWTYHQDTAADTASFSCRDLAETNSHEMVLEHDLEDNDLPFLPSTKEVISTGRILAEMAHARGDINEQDIDEVAQGYDAKYQADAFDTFGTRDYSKAFSDLNEQFALAALGKPINADALRIGLRAVKGSLSEIDTDLKRLHGFNDLSPEQKDQWIRRSVDFTRSITHEDDPTPDYSLIRRRSQDAPVSDEDRLFGENDRLAEIGSMQREHFVTERQLELISALAAELGISLDKARRPPRSPSR